MAISAARVAVGGAVIGSSELYALDGLNNYPEVAADPDRDRYLAVSWVNGGNPDVGGRLVSGDGTPLGDPLAVAASAGFEGGDGIGVAFDRGAATYLAVFQGPESAGQVQQVWGAPVAADGSVGGSFQITTSTAENGVYQPRAAADGAGRFLVVTVADYARIDAQWVTFPIAPDGGSGSGGSGGSAGSGAGGSAGSGAADGGPPSRGGTTSDDGCGCRIPAGERGGSALVAVALMAGLRARRRAARSTRRC
jgi:hypothetical protein